MLILCWTTKLDGLFVDHYTTFETLDTAQRAYDLIRADDNCYSASLCKPIISTEPHYLETHHVS
jgi:hypothetical protein